MPALAAWETCTLSEPAWPLESRMAKLPAPPAERSMASRLRRTGAPAARTLTTTLCPARNGRTLPCRVTD